MSGLRQHAIKVAPRPALAVGDKVKFGAEKRKWTVRGVTNAGRFVILTQPFNLKHTVLYSVVDFDRGVRGRDNYYGLGYETEQQIAEVLHCFQHTEDDDPPEVTNECTIDGAWCTGQVEVSGRSANHIRLDFQAIGDTPTDWQGLATPAHGDRP